MSDSTVIPNGRNGTGGGGRLTRSSRRDPCPVCGRSKDGKCSTTDAGLVLCWRGTSHQPPQWADRKGDHGAGSDGQQWAFLGDSDGWGQFRLHEALPAKPIRPMARRSWTYSNRDGNPLITVNRTDDGSGNRSIWQSSEVPGSKPAALLSQAAPYGYSEALQALADGAPVVLWVEGEPCVDALRRLGLPAVTSIGGAGKFNPARDGGLFPPDRLVIAPDRDHSGIEHGHAIAAAYPGARWLLCWPDQPHLWNGSCPKAHGLDVADWIEAGATGEMILAAITDTAPQLPSLEPKGSSKPKTNEQKLEALSDTAAALLASKVAYAARLPLLRATAETLEFTIRDQELMAILTAARRRRANDGQDDMLQPGERLDLTPEPWAWDGMVLRGALNLWVALPKVGKTSLVLAWLNAWFRHEPAFLDRTLIGPCPPVLIVGTDQGQADWGRMLQEVGWVDAAGTIGGPLVGLVHAGRPLHLDPEGIDRIAEKAQQHPGLVVVVDSLSACLMPLGLKEESPQIAEPVQDLMEQLEPHGATLVVIHHASKGRAGEGAASASRGSTALPAAASQILKLAPASANEADHRRLLTTQGRGGLPQSLVIQRDGPSWNLLGGAELLEREQSQADAESKLTERQLDALREVRERWEDRIERTTAAQLVEALELAGKDAARVARQTLLGLHQKGLLEMVARSQPGRGSRVNEFWPKANEPANGPPRVGAPDLVSVGSVGSVGSASCEDPERSNPLSLLSYQPTDPTDPTDQRTSAPTREVDGMSVGSEPTWHAIARRLSLEHPGLPPALIGLKLGAEFRHVTGRAVKEFLSADQPA